MGGQIVWEQNSSILRKKSHPFSELLNRVQTELINSPEVKEELNSLLEGNRISGSARGFESISWFFTCISILKKIVSHSHNGGLEDVDVCSWFFEVEQGDISGQCKEFSRSCELELEEVISYESLDEVRENLPHLLDTFGPTSRLDMIRGRGTQKSRENRKSQAFFTTPIDVCEFMVQELENKSSKPFEECLILDPAVGSGMFLRSCMRHFVSLRECGPVELYDWIKNHIFGIDIDPLMKQSTTLVLLCELAESSVFIDGPPVALWAAIEKNIKCLDSLEISPPINQPINSSFFNENRKTDRLSSVFPEVKNGFDIVIGNPPYSALNKSAPGILSETNNLINCSTDVSILFAEMMWLFTNQIGVSALVLPLSVASNRSKPFKELRRKMQTNPFCWWFSCFDREPCGLFGEDVKTRNVIAIMKKNGEEHHPVRIPHESSGSFELDNQQIESMAEINVTGLEKFTSRSRGKLFSELQFHDISDLSIIDFIPKIANEETGVTFRSYGHKSNSVPSLIDTFSIDSIPLEQGLSGLNVDSEGIKERVLVGGTAYNYLNVMLDHDLEEGIFDEDPIFSQSKLYAIDSSEHYIIYSILSSRTAYHIWRIESDGFHVNKSFVEKFPNLASSMSQEDRYNLCALGETMWSLCKLNPVVSINGGRTSLSYRPYVLTSLRNEIDSIILRYLGVAPSEIPKIIECYELMESDLVVVDSDDPRREEYSKTIAYEAC